MKQEKKTSQLSIRVKDSTHERLYKLAAKNNRSVSFIVESILRRYLRLE
jgi:predicted transcriptional regulator